MTKRVTVPELEELLDKELKVHGYGFVRVIDYMGADSSIVQAARISYGSGTKQLHQDAGLINYLMRNNHTSPFEMCEIKLHIKLPIFVARQWIRHRTANVNEHSARYSEMSLEFYIPEKLHKQGAVNKQCGGEAMPNSAPGITAIVETARDAYKTYKKLLEEGVSREEARMVLPPNYYTSWYWKIDLHNLLNFIRLRTGSGAQREIRAYAEVLVEIVKAWVPITWDAFEKHVLNSKVISQKMAELAGEYMSGGNPNPEDFGLSKSEIAYFRDVFGVDFTEI